MNPIYPPCQIPNATPAGRCSHFSHGDCANKDPKAKKKIYAIEKVPEDPEYDLLGESIRESSDYDQDPIEELLVEYKQELQLENQDIHLEAR
ncbi:hypothetical protein O181_027258 [Austropuccinia psidii MF-1]|uniref:Uncharacterized protein n=1 Tax=Austropuccinia psidii MF-1 TaxID=1389203 RepID=A0A9Q3CRG8_9BASI|nr:hypothetical protein [Austropuccinia psidii MF-1]